MKQKFYPSFLLTRCLMLTAALVIAVQLALTGCSAKGSHVITELPIPSGEQSVTQYAPPASETWRLDNGLVVMLNPNRELPIVSGTLHIRGGSLWEARDTQSIVAAMGGQMRAGGTRTLSPDQLDRELELLSASVGSGFGAEIGSVSFSALSSDLDRVFALFSEVLLEPRFDQSRLDLWKGQALEVIRRRKDDPNTIAEIALSQLVYQNHNLGRFATSSDVKKISRQKLIDSHQRLVRPDQAVLALSGDLSRADAERLVNRYLSAWQARGSKLQNPALARDGKGQQIFLIEGPFTQATIYAGQLGAERLSPDLEAIEIFNSIFGSGGFGSRLMRKIRADLGLAYGAYGTIGQGVVRGRNSIVLSTKAESTGLALLETLAQLQDMKDNPVSDSELQEAQSALENSFLFRFDAPEKVVQREAMQYILGYPADFDREYLLRINKVDQAAVMQAARRYWNMDALTVVVVGNELALEQVEAVVKDQSSPLAGWLVKRVEFGEILNLKSPK